MVIGNLNAVVYKEIFPYIKDNKIRLGYNSISTFVRPDGSLKGAIGRWYTTLKTKISDEKLILVQKYDSTKYPKYENYDAINVDKVVDIPLDYNGVMGVPISFLDKYNPKQFKNIGSPDANIVPELWKGMTKEFVNLYYKQGNTGLLKDGNRLCHLIKNNKAKVPYKRILIQKVNNDI